MKITSVRATPFSLPLEYVVASAGMAQTVSTIPDVLVRVESDSGHTGAAEAWGTPEAWGEGQYATVDMINNHLAAHLVGLDPLDTERITTVMNPPTGLAYGFAAKAAVDMAIHDLIGKALNVPVYKFLGGWADPPIVNRTWMLGLGDPAKLAAEVRELADTWGYKAFKLKVGRDPNRDVAAVAAVRNELGDDALIYVDANAIYAPDVAIRTIRRMAEYGLAWVEDPCAWNLPSSVRRKVVDAVGVPVMGDMCSHNAEAVLRELQQGTSDIIALKLFRTGFTESKRIVKLAQEFGAPCVLGASGESTIGKLAGAHLVAGLKNLAQQPAELCFTTGDEILTDDSPKIEGATIELDPSRPGLGFEIDEEKLTQYEDKYESALAAV
jgi:L-Ala-D/L-Glu epimerase